MIAERACPFHAIEAIAQGLASRKLSIAAWRLVVPGHLFGLSDRPPASPRDAYLSAAASAYHT
jgi:hypothetical protein